MFKAVLSAFLFVPFLMCAQEPAIPGCQTTEGDFFSSQARILTSRSTGRAPETVIAEFKERADKAPNDSVAQYLYALSLMGSRTPESIKILTEITGKEPKFAWPFAKLADIYAYPAFRDDTKFEVNARAYVNLCPENVDAYTRLSRLPNSEYLREATARFRTLLTGRTDVTVLSAWPALWRLEFKVTPVPGHNKLREQVAKDLESLKALDPKVNKLAVFALREGYKIIGDKEGEKAISASDGSSGSGNSKVFQAMNDWNKKNPYPKTGDPQVNYGEKYKEREEARLKVSDEWIALGNGEPYFYLQKAQILANLENHPDSEFLAAIDQYFEALKSRKNSVISTPSSSTQIASMYVRRNLRLDQVPGLVKEGLIELSKRYGNQENDLMMSADRKEQQEISVWREKTMGWGLLADAYLKQKKLDEVRKTLIEMDSGLREFKRKTVEWEKRIAETPKDKPPAMSTSSIQSAIRMLPGDESRYYDYMARLAVEEGRKLDAVTYYGSAARAWKTTFPSGTPTRLTRPAEAIWKELGGTNEGWQHWLDQLSAAPSSGSNALPQPGQWTKLERPLPEFEITDLQGKTWKKASLNGKTAFINLWATWCGPCREELPHFQKLYDRAKEREDVIILTFNVDDTIGAVEPFMKENKYTFPVLFAKDVVDRYLGGFSIPRNWVVDRAGLLRFEQVGFGSSNDAEWIKKMLDQIEVVRGF